MKPGYLTADEIHARIGSRWPEVLQQLGVSDQYLSKKNGPCPGCGGRDRYFFSNKFGHGDFFCRHCSPVIGGKQRGGDGFALLQMVHGWDFKTARNRVIEAAGLPGEDPPMMPLQTSAPVPAVHPARPVARVRRLRGELCRLEDCRDAVTYLGSRELWPAAASSSLRAHPSLEYYDSGQRLDRFAAIVADVRDFGGEVVTVHTTYLRDGRKLANHEPRKILSPMVGREACAVRLYRLSGDEMGIAEGLETAIAASLLHDCLPVWAALNTSLLAKFKPPADIERLLVFADNDVPGLKAAAALLERLQGQVRVEIRTPPASAKDWNDVLTNKSRNEQ